MTFNEFIGKSVWCMYNDGDKQETMVATVLGVEEGAIIFQTSGNKVLIPINKITKIKLKINGR